MPLKDVLITHQILFLCRHIFPIFLTLLKCSVEYHSLGPHWYFEKKSLSKHYPFDKFGSILIGILFSFKSFLHFLCRGVALASFKELGNIEDLNVALEPLHKMSAKTSAFPLTILVEISLF